MQINYKTTNFSYISFIPFMVTNKQLNYISFIPFMVNNKKLSFISFMPFMVKKILDIFYGSKN
jgi:hypothetical protein